MASDNIIRLAKSCQKIFTDTLTQVSEPTHLEGWLEAQASRLRIWTNTLGVFAESELSIAHRLSNNTSDANTIAQFLDALEYNLELLQSTVLGTELPAAAAQESDGEFSDVSAESIPSDDDRMITRQKDRIEGGLRRLTFVANKIRLQEIEQDLKKVAEFQPLGTDGAPLENKFQRFIAATLHWAFGPAQNFGKTGLPASAQSREPNDPDREIEHYRIPEYLRERVGRTMLDRWRRISYQRHHSNGLARAMNSSATGNTPSLVDPQIHPNDDRMMSNDSYGKNPKISIRDPETSAPELIADDVLPKESGNSQKAVLNSVRDGTLCYPVLPRVNPGTESFSCTICGSLKPARLLQRLEWHAHVMQDMSPYFCIHVDCPEPQVTYQTIEAWLRHCRRAHARYCWTCNACPQEVPNQFEDPDEFSRHFKEQHADHNAFKSQHADLERVTEALIEFTRQLILEKIPRCLFCGFEPENDQGGSNEAVMNHMAKQHMHGLALASMPWDIPRAEEVSKE
ncbi:uncharacterized protein K489DRAFT_130067 [Dissoconium aciculare CBS 342.82]|uniref:C2H2-type domain-containing protein n=1 Tax=Dissoconium aciculare CBS 342.82 TaxID=1314786 RepID=A0A6J3LU85_9PEZI|nr:uncharacterized protein K489DRAFT_130067 [Dissoconium aciculare CBS 342.82]KAF1818182.1 hypothetical protein K489DRAFT_130067 [Dissoconium aciculare CBS 342.82]